MDEKNLKKWEKSYLTKYINEMREEFNNLKLDIDNYKKLLFDSNENDESIKDKINNYLLSIENLSKKLEEYNNKIQLYYTSLIWDWNEKSIKNEIDDIYKDIQNYNSYLFWDNNQDKSWLKNDIDILFEKLSINNKKAQTLEEKIEKLLSWATSVWLASAYQENRKSFSKPKIFWNIIFFLSIFFMVLISTWSNLDIKTMTFIQHKDFQETINYILSRLPFILPLLWLWLYSSNQQAQNKRLEQEYYHKESIAKSYEWYKKEINNLWEDEESKKILRKLMDNMVEITKYNPSITLDKIKTHNLISHLIKNDNTN